MILLVFLFKKKHTHNYKQSIDHEIRKNKECNKVLMQKAQYIYRRGKNCASSWRVQERSEVNHVFYI